MKWEYRVIDESYLEEENQDLQVFLNKLGEEGWRLIPTLFQYPHEKTHEPSHETILIMEREKK